MARPPPAQQGGQLVIQVAYVAVVGGGAPRYARAMRSIQVLLLAVAATGCHASSLQPLFTPSQRVEVPGVVGTWVEDKADKPITLVIAAMAEQQLDVVLRDKDGETRFIAAAGKVGPATWLDVQLSPSDERSKPAQAFVVRPHFFLRVQQHGDALAFEMVDEKWLRTALASKKIKLAHEVLNRGTDDEHVLFTAPTGELHAAVKKLQGGPGVFGEPLAFRRAKP